MSDNKGSFLSRLAMLFGASSKAPREPVIHPVPGDLIRFGCYPQAGAQAKSEPIEWIVLEVKEDRALLLSRKVLDSMPYNTKMVDGSNAYSGYVADTAWWSSDVHKWLNYTFLAEYFSAEEKKAILTAKLDIGAKDSWPGYNIPFSTTTKDKMFLLGFADVKRYFGADNARDPHPKENVRARAEATAYALFRGVHRSKDYLTADGKPSAQWWLRSRGQNGCDAVYICYEGYAHNLLVNEKGIGVRPAFWLDLTASVLRSRESVIIRR